MDLTVNAELYTLNYMKNLALIVAAGSGSRFGGETPKQYQLLNGKPVLLHSIEAFANHPDIDAVRVVIAADDKSYNFKHPKLLDPVIGGAERQDSVRLGLEGLEGYDNVLIHDAARPYVGQNLISRIIDALKKYDSVVPVLSVAESVRVKGEAVDRREVFIVQTPQAFHYKIISSAHKKMKGKVYTDDAQVVEAAGGKLHFVEGDPMNKKITTKEDMDKQATIRTGMGFDVHEFETGTHVTICGIKIPHSHQLKGHSDADVGLHALTDAILGAIGEGDIGEHFPPSETKWRNADSTLFLKHALELARKKNAVISNVDVTIICEEPKLSEYKPKMRAKVAEILETTLDCVNIKATTTEKLGFTGRKEGIAAQSIATVKFLG